jgi:hypothetical protein
MGYRIIAELAGLRVNRLASETRCEIEDPKWGGYLANMSPAEFEDDYIRKLPDRLSGAEFLARYGGTTDRVKRVDRAREYAVRIPTAHPIYEHQRVRRFAELLCTDVPMSDRGRPRPHRWISRYSFSPNISFERLGGRGRRGAAEGRPYNFWAS